MGDGVRRSPCASLWLWKENMKWVVVGRNGLALLGRKTLPGVWRRTVAIRFAVARCMLSEGFNWGFVAKGKNYTHYRHSLIS